MTPPLPDPPQAMDWRYRARVTGWGGVAAGYAQLFQPERVGELPKVFDLARATGRSVGLRGAGRSYGDAALNSNGLMLDCSRLNQILGFDAATGRIAVEPGVTIQQLWQATLPAGWWPPVVPGTMFPTLGGVSAANIHGKNNYVAGPLGDHIVACEVLLPSGEYRLCSRSESPELFHAVIGGFGLFGVLTRIELQLKRVHSGYLLVEPKVTGSLTEMLDLMSRWEQDADYMVGWLDCLAGGNSFGRGLVHLAWYLPPGADPEPAESQRVAAQHLPKRVMGVLPKSLVPLLARPLVNDLGMRAINAAKWWSAAWGLQGHRYWQTHAGFAFLLDYIPGWQRSYGPGGLVQFQSFVPKEAAARVFSQILQSCLEAGFPSYLGVVKRHRPDAFLLSHGVDGFSLALDFRVPPGQREALWQLLQRLDREVLAADGRFYFAKDLTLAADRVPALWPPGTLETATRLRQACDPEGLLQTDLARRLFPQWYS